MDFGELAVEDGSNDRRQLGPFLSWVQLALNSRRSAQVSGGLAVARRRRTKKDKVHLGRDLWSELFAHLPAQIRPAEGFMWHG